MISKISSAFDVLVKWVWLSSANPEAASLTVKGAAMFAIPWILKAVAFSCGAGFFCTSGLDVNLLESIAGVLGNIVFFLFSLTGALVALVGFIRKVVRSFSGKNLAV